MKSKFSPEESNNQDKGEAKKDNIETTLKAQGSQKLPLKIPP